MSGFDTNRIVGLDSRFAETIQCSICLLILNNPLMTKCGHNYCNQCIKEIVENGVKSCPDCRKAFTKKRPKESSDNSDVVFRRNRDVFVFSKNLKLNEIIGKLKISCDYESNGCKESVELESLSQHMTRCEYRFCKTCGFRPIGESDEHNCIEVLKNDRNEWKVKYEKSVNINKEFEDKINAEINRINGLHLQTIKELNEKLEEELRQKNEWKVKYENEVKRIDICSKGKVKVSKDMNKLKKKLQELEEKNLKNKKLESNTQMSVEMKTSKTKSLLLNREDSNSIDIKVNESNLWKCIESGEVDNHLIGVYNRTIDSKRREIFDIRSKQMSSFIRTHSLKFVPNYYYAIYYHCQSLYNNNCNSHKTTKYVDLKRYEFLTNVWIPEAIVKAITIVYNCDWIRAEELFNKIIG